MFSGWDVRSGSGGFAIAWGFCRTRYGFALGSRVPGAGGLPGGHVPLAGFSPPVKGRGVTRVTSPGER
jgi:hypothetical protein